MRKADFDLRYAREGRIFDAHIQVDTGRRRAKDISTLYPSLQIFPERHVR